VEIIRNNQMQCSSSVRNNLATIVTWWHMQIIAQVMSSRASREREEETEETI
jgi:hypothetical protein